MCEITYDITYTDLNPKFLYSCVRTNISGEESHCHDFVELVVIMKGKGYFTINDREYPVSEGNFIILNPNTYHKSMTVPNTSQEYKECYLAFTDVEFKDCRKNHLPPFHGEDPIKRLPEDLKKTLFHLCGAIDQESSHYEAGRCFMLKSYLIQILCLVERFRIQEIQEKEKNNRTIPYEFKSITKKYIVQKIMKYMEENYQEKISLDQIASNMYLSSYYISKLFKSETGDTPINYLISLRMKKARELLNNNPGCSIKEVASTVGYDDAYHFSKLFKKYFGLSPLHYKMRLGI